MARREWTRACAVCQGDITNSGTSKVHRECQGEWQRQQYDNAKRFEPQAVTFAPEAKTIETEGKTIEQILAEARGNEPPRATPEGRPWHDIRNNARFNKARREMPDELRERPPFRVAVYDLETSDLYANIGVVLVGGIVIWGPDNLYLFSARQYDAWKRGQRSDDREIVCDILAVLETCDIHIAHNGCEFDRKFLNGRAAEHHLPPVHPQKIYDPCLLGRKNLGLRSNRLDAMGDHLGIDVGKTPFVSKIWRKAALDGDEDCMNYIEQHCVADVIGLAKLARELAPWVKELNSIGSFARR